MGATVLCVGELRATMARNALHSGCSRFWRLEFSFWLLSILFLLSLADLLEIVGEEQHQRISDFTSAVLHNYLPWAPAGLPLVLSAESDLGLPSPPPSFADCVCSEGYTSTPSGSPCGCVIPIQVGIELGVALDTLFPLVIELAKELADGSFLQQSQVRILGATADSDYVDKTEVKADLVPLGVAFDDTTAQLISQRFWTKQVDINGTLFGNYSILYVIYPGLPPSPPFKPPGTGVDGSPPGTTGDSNSPVVGEKPKSRNSSLGGGVLAIISLSSAVAVVIILGITWFVIVRCCQNGSHLGLESNFSSTVKQSADGSNLSNVITNSRSISLSSTIPGHSGSTRNFSLFELERATCNFKLENVVGEGGFGRVYQGVLDDGLKVAVKVLTRDDEQSELEFLAEAELLGRLHHRNLVKLIGICTDQVHSFVYELVPNGSVESHLHGLDKGTSPLNWDNRIKIALGAARGLAYLHEDSNPRVIHRDFKASNILLDDDCTPKVSDFGLAKVATEGKEHISTRVMGTFGYVAPEYAMTGHLLVKSDVYSYGVVLLELITGRKPVDMSQPPGQENLVTWARPLLTSNDGLQLLIDPSLGHSFSYENLARVAAIASMCVNPEVSHRPFMGEVVQALKLVWNDSDTTEGQSSITGSQGGESLLGNSSSGLFGTEVFGVPTALSSGPSASRSFEPIQTLSASAVLVNSSKFVRQLSGSLKRHSNSGPLRTTRSQPAWYKVRHPEGNRKSEHSINKYVIELERDYIEFWP